jgi:hypothetical protein
VQGKKSGYTSPLCDGPYIYHTTHWSIDHDGKKDKAKLIMQFGGCCFVFSTSSLIQLHQAQSYIFIYFIDLEQIYK